MKIRDKTSSTPVRAVAAPAAPTRVEPVASGAQPVRDVATVMGIPEAEFTPRVRQAIITLLAEVEALRRELKDAKGRVSYLERLADQDTLVPVVNRRAFVRELSRTMSYARRYQVPCSVLYFDINGMKAINDSYGHAAGDAAIAHVAEMLIGSVRDSDVVGRLGGDEFGVVLVHVDGAQAAEKALALAAAVEARPLQYRGTTIPIGVAYGSYQIRAEEDADAVLDGADKAMYAQKKKGDGSAKR